MNGDLLRWLSLGLQMGVLFGVLASCKGRAQTYLRLPLALAVSGLSAALLLLEDSRQLATNAAVAGLLAGTAWTGWEGSAGSRTRWFLAVPLMALASAVALAWILDLPGLAWSNYVPGGTLLATVSMIAFEPVASSATRAHDHSGALLAMGLVALSMTLLFLVLGPLSALGVPLAAATWVLANRNLRSMQRGLIEDRTRNLVIAGQSCAVAALALAGLLVAGAVLPLALSLVSR